MSMVVKNNIPAVYGLGTLNRNSTALSKSLEKVSTGMKINSAADDNSAWSISERMRVRIRGLDQADQNTQNGRSLLKVAEGAVQSTVDILKTLKEKAINAANDTNTDADRQTIQKELNQSIDQIDDNANVTYNGKILMDGSKNTLGSATYTALTNQSLSMDTQAGTLLTDLRDRSGASLGILSTDKVTVSYVQGGKTYATTYTVGSTAVFNILTKAESIESATQTFATKGNLSVAKAKGITDLAAIQAEEARLNAAVTTALGELNAAQTAVDTAQSAVDAQTTALNTAQSNINSAKSALAGNYSTLSSAINAMQPFQYSYGYTGNVVANQDYVNNVKTQFSAWSGTATSATGNMPNPSTVTSASYGHLHDFVNASQITSGTAAAGYENAVNLAKAAYNAWSNYSTAYGNTYASSDGTLVSSLKDPYDTAVAALATARGELSTAQETWNAKKSAYDTAVNNRDAFSGPQLLTDDKIGLMRSGEMLKTVDGKNALTITAQNSGIGGQISGFSVRITDSEGNVKTAANAALDAFSETIRAENASEDNALTLHVGADPGVAINLGMTDMRSEALGLKGADGTKLDISTQERANAAISVLDNAIQKALNQQTDIGNIASRLEYTSANLRVASDNVQASESTIRDADMAKEMTAYTKNNVLLSASQSMLSQANQNSMNVMTLLQ